MKRLSDIAAGLGALMIVAVVLIMAIPVFCILMLMHVFTCLTAVGLSAMELMARHLERWSR